MLPFLCTADVGPLRTGGAPIKEPRVNDKIRVKEVRLVDPKGGQIGIKSIEEARWLANQLELDLVEVAPEARPPVVRLMDYGKYKYDQSVKAREARKKQTRTVIKECSSAPRSGKRLRGQGPSGLSAFCEITTGEGDDALPGQRGHSPGNRERDSRTAREERCRVRRDRNPTTARRPPYDDGARSPEGIGRSEPREEAPALTSRPKSRQPKSRSVAPCQR